MSGEEVSFCNELNNFMKSILLNKICPLVILLVLMLNDKTSAQVHYSPSSSLSSINNTFMQRAQNRRYLFNRIVSTAPHNFRIMFNDATQIMAIGTIKTDSSSYYLLVENKTFAKMDSGRYRKILPSKTEYICRTDMNNGAEYKGIATDSCWLFKKIEGAVNAYTPSPEDFIRDTSITYLQKGDNTPLIKMSQEKIENIVGDDPKALKLAQKKDTLKAILKYNDDMVNKIN